jgi:hypothetical protein
MTSKLFAIALLVACNSYHYGFAMEKDTGLQQRNAHNKALMLIAVVRSTRDWQECCDNLLKSYNSLGKYPEVAELQNFEREIKAATKVASQLVPPSKALAELALANVSLKVAYLQTPGAQKAFKERRQKEFVLKTAGITAFAGACTLLVYSSL